ncbi:MAG: hypothetical protein HFJ46_03755 [Clostridia bacterium]|jgi:hypothetical protein|nr:hypothetical protein [Clostridia bacterium]
MKEFFDKVTDFLFNIWEKIEKLTEKINESTGVKINAPMLVGLAFLFIFAFILAKSILSWVFSSL